MLTLHFESLIPLSPGPASTIKEVLSRFRDLKLLLICCKFNKNLYKFDLGKNSGL